MSHVQLLVLFVHMNSSLSEAKVYTQRILLPEGVTQTEEPTFPPGRNRWFASQYTECSRTCEGTQTRDVYCRRTLSSDRSRVRVPDRFCDQDDPRIKPIERRSCGQECATYTWDTTAWSNCSAVCGAGTQTRTVRCRKVTRTSDTFVADRECIRENIGLKPRAQRNCNSACSYETSAWSVCSVTCGGGTRTRTIRCVHTAGDGSTTTVRPSDCAADDSLTRPRGSEECNTDLCGEYRWITGDYGNCSNPCGGVRTRDVYCGLVTSDGSHTRDADRHCTGSKPTATIPCAQTVPETDRLYDLIRDSVCPDTCCLNNCDSNPTACSFTYPGQTCGCPLTTYSGTCQQESFQMEEHADVIVRCTCQHADEGGRNLEKERVEPLPTVSPSG